MNPATDAIEHLFTEHGARPTVGIVLGSGLGAFVDQLQEARALDYRQIPGMPGVSVGGHAGKLWVGRLGGHSIACLQGRSHLYEGYTPQEVVFAVRLLATAGVGAMLITNAAGGLGAGFQRGDLMLVTDHLNLTGHNPLLGPAPATGPRFSDMTFAYDPGLRTLALQAAQELGMSLRQGVYAGVLGPSYETPAEIRMLRLLGADAVGMSTVLETIALRQMGARVGGVSLISNLAAGLSDTELSHAEVQATAEEVRERFTRFVSHWCGLILRAPA
ncbi:MAG TPA: purine-nucleoside phosphorylase [Polyangiaceae bacterium]